MAVGTSSHPQSLPEICANLFLVTLTCLGKLSRVDAKSFNLQTEIFPFVEEHYTKLAPVNGK